MAHFCRVWVGHFSKAPKVKRVTKSQPVRNAVFYVIIQRFVESAENIVEYR